MDIRKYKCICGKKTKFKYCSGYHKYIASRSLVGESVTSWEKRKSDDVVATSKARHNVDYY